jgi:hypothetical protein
MSLCPGDDRVVFDQWIPPCPARGGPDIPIRRRIDRYRAVAGPLRPRRRAYTEDSCGRATGTGAGEGLWFFGSSGNSR